MDKKMTKDISKRTLATIIHRNGVKTEKHRGPTKDMIKRTLEVSRRVWLAKGYSDVTKTVYVNNYDKESNPWSFPATGLYKSFDEIMNQLQEEIDKAFPLVAFPYRVLSDEITLYQRNPEDIDYLRELAIIKIGDGFKNMIENNTDNKPFGCVATEAQIDRGVAEWCWECGNTKCPSSKQDVLVMCDQFVQRSQEDLESDPHFSR